jgi:hypothetical protein
LKQCIIPDIHFRYFYLLCLSVSGYDYKMISFFWSIRLLILTIVLLYSCQIEFISSSISLPKAFAWVVFYAKYQAMKDVWFPHSRSYGKILSIYQTDKQNNKMNTLNEIIYSTYYVNDVQWDQYTYWRNSRKLICLTK